MVDSTGTSLRTAAHRARPRRPAVDQQRRGDAAGERAQLVDGLAGLGSAASMVSAARSGSSSSCCAGPAEVHREPHQPLLRPVVDVALEPAQRLGLGGASGVAAALDPAYLLLELGPAAEQHLRQAAVQERGGPHHQGRVSSATTPDHEVEQRSRGRRPSPKPSSSARVSASGPSGIQRSQNQ